MAYMDASKKAKLVPQIKKVLAKYKMKGTISVRNHLSLVVTIKSGALDLITDFNDGGEIEWMQRGLSGWTPATSIDVNPYHYKSHFKVARHVKFLDELIAAMNGAGADGVRNHDRSDIMTDYFDVGWYIDINIGKWNKPYIKE